MLFSISATIDRIEGNRVILAVEENPQEKIARQEIIWPKSELPPGISTGEVVGLEILKQADAQKSKEELAKSIINELLTRSEEKGL